MFNQQLEPMIAENNQAFAIKIEHLHFLTKDRSQAISFVHVDKNAEVGVKIIKELKDPNNTHKYTMKSVIKEINRRLQNMGIDFTINQYIFDLFNKKYGIKENEKYCYVHRQYAQPSYTYSMQVIEMIVDEIAKEPENIVEYLKRTKNKLTPGAKEFLVITYSHSGTQPYPSRVSLFIVYHMNLRCQYVWKIFLI